MIRYILLWSCFAESTAQCGTGLQFLLPYSPGKTFSWSEARNTCRTRSNAALSTSSQIVDSQRSSCIINILRPYARLLNLNLNVWSGDCTKFGTKCGSWVVSKDTPSNDKYLTERISKDRTDSFLILCEQGQDSF